MSTGLVLWGLLTGSLLNKSFKVHISFYVFSFANVIHTWLGLSIFKMLPLWCRALLCWYGGWMKIKLFCQYVFFAFVQHQIYHLSVICIGRVLWKLWLVWFVALYKWWSVMGVLSCLVWLNMLFGLIYASVMCVWNAWMCYASYVHASCYHCSVLFILISRNLFLWNCILVLQNLRSNWAMKFLLELNLESISILLIDCKLSKLWWLNLQCIYRSLLLTTVV